MTNSILEIISKQAQSYYKEMPVIILGSGASAAHGVSGMQPLSEFIVKSVDVADFNDADMAAWDNFCGLLLAGVDLEGALHQVALSPTTTQKIISATWNFLAPQDRKIFDDSINDENYFPLGKLLRHMLRSTATTLNIVTPNYDRLAEYSCEQEGIHHFSGFSHGYRGHITQKEYLKCARQVNIWKVHGSLGWFINANGVICSLGNIERIPESLTPLIVTPGVAKYRSTHRDPYKTIIHMSDEVLDKAKSYLCIGFGFNDEHIQEKLVNRCAKGDASVIVITHKLSDSAKKFLFNGNAKNYLAIEAAQDSTSSIVYSSSLPNTEEVNLPFWQLNKFLTLIL